MKVIVMHEDNHGMVGLAETFQDAVKYLIKHKWLDEKFEVWQPNDETTTIIEDLGIDWVEIILGWDIQKFNEYFEGCFNLCTEEIFKAEE